MGRPKKHHNPMSTYCLLIDQDVLDVVYCISVKKTKELGKHVTKAAIIREAISFWLREKKHTAKVNISSSCENLQ